MPPITEQIADRLTGGRLSALGATLTATETALRETRGDMRKLERTVEGMQDGTLAESATGDWLNRLQRDRGWVIANGATVGAMRNIQKNDVDMYLDLATFAYYFNPLIKSAVNVKTRWTFAKQFSITSINDANQATIEEVLKDPLNKNAFFSKQAIREIDHELQKGGNVFPAIHTYTTPMGVRCISSYEITDIINDPEDSDRPMYYCRTWTADDGKSMQAAYPSIFNDTPAETITASGIAYTVNPDITVYHMHTAKSPKQKWALSELTAARPWAQAHAQFLEDFGAVVASIRKISMMMVTKGGQAQVTALSAQFAGNQSAMGTPMQSNPAGSMLVASEGNDLRVVDAGSGKMVGLADSREFMHQVCADTGVPDTLLVGDSNNGNLATAAALEGPFGILIEDRQSDWQCTFEMIFGKILGNNEFEVSFPPLRANVAAYITAINNVATLGQAGNWAGTVTAKDYIKAVHEAMEWKLPDDVVVDAMAAAIEERAAQAPEAPGVDAGLDAIAQAANGLQEALRRVREEWDPNQPRGDDGKWGDGGGGSGSGDTGGHPGKNNTGGTTVSIGGEEVPVENGEYVVDGYKRATGKDMEFDGSTGVDVRYTSSDSDPMSDYGHAMFVNGDKESRVSGYGDNRWVYDRSSGTDVEDLKSDFVSAWDEDRESGLIPQSEVGADFNDISGDEMWSSVNPDDIVDSAGFWDEGKLMQWYYERVAEPNDIGAINTKDGSIIWDKDLIKNAGKGVK